MPKDIETKRSKKKDKAKRNQDLYGKFNSRNIRKYEQECQRTSGSKHQSMDR